MDSKMDNDNDNAKSIIDEAVGEAIVHYSAEEEKAVLRKVDRRLLPLMFVAYMLQFLDKISLGYGAIMGLRTDLHLVGQEYSWASSAFYFGYLFATYPITLGFVKLPLAKYLCSFMLIWTIIILLIPVASNAGGLIALRVLLGIFESAISPGFALITSMWYTPKEHPSRHALWFAGNSVSSVFGGFLSYGIAQITGIAPWKVLFILFGGVTLIWVIVMFIYLPDNQQTANFLTPTERQIAYLRVQRAQRTVKSGKYNVAHIKEAILDPKIWLIFAYSFLSSMANGALTNFGSIIVQGFGFTQLQTLLLNVPSAVWGITLVVSGMFITHKVPNSRLILVVFYLCISLTGALMIHQLPSHMKVARLIGSYLFASVAACFPFMLSMISSNVAGYTKKTVANATFFVGYCVGNIAGPQTFKSHEAPSYPTAFVTMIICMTICIVAVITLGVLLVFENTRRERKYPGSSTLAYAGRETTEDLTDFEQEETFRYRF